MNDVDLLWALSDSRDSLARSLVKEAADVRSAGDVSKDLAKESINARKVPLATALLFALYGGGKQYLANRKGPTGLSKEQINTRDALEALEKEEAAERERGEKPGYFKSMQRQISRTQKGVADVWAEHPVMGAMQEALTAGGIGYGSGAFLQSVGKTLSKRGGSK